MVEVDSVVLEKRSLYLQITMDRLVTNNQDSLVLLKIMQHQKLVVLVRSVLRALLASRFGCTTRRMVDGTSIHKDSVVDLCLDSIAAQKLLYSQKSLPQNCLPLRVQLHSRQSVVKLELVKRISWLEVVLIILSSSIQLTEYSPSVTLKLIVEHTLIMSLQLLMLKVLTMDTLQIL